MSFFIFKNFIFSIYLGILISIFSVFTVFGETSNKYKPGANTATIPVRIQR